MATIIDKDRFRDRAVASHGSGGDGGDGGGTVDEMQKRIVTVETAVGETRGDIREIKVVLPNLVTKAELGAFRCEVKTELAEVRGDIREIKAILPHLATKAEFEALARKQIQWFVGTAVGLTALAFSAAKFVH
jgi:hypothetical protein